ncbi:MAG: type II secretion system protein M [Sphingomonas sp.]|nr:type II secretion system protein M [Sphingomonas sp.]
MSGDFKLWWAGRTARERWLLLVMFVLLALVIGWLGIVRPLGNAQTDARLRLETAATALAEARARSATAVDTPRPAATAQPPIDALLARTASDAGFANARIDAQGPLRASVTIEAGRPQALFGWIGALEGQGVTVEGLRARPNQDRTIQLEANFAIRSAP